MQTVYLGKAGPIHKIGRSNNLVRRMTELSMDSRFWVGYPTQLVRTFESDNAQVLELYMKRLLKPWQYTYHAEWFTLPEILATWLYELPPWVAPPLTLPIADPRKRKIRGLTK